MRYADFLDRLKQSQAEIEARRNASQVYENAHAAVRELGERCYEIRPGTDDRDTGRLVVRLEVSVFSGVGISFFEGPWRVPSGMTSELLARASACVAYIESWLRGEIDELAPSGPWPLVPTAPTTDVR